MEVMTTDNVTSSKQAKRDFGKAGPLLPNKLTVPLLKRVYEAMNIRILKDQRRKAAEETKPAN